MKLKYVLVLMLSVCLIAAGSQDEKDKKKEKKKKAKPDAERILGSWTIKEVRMNGETQQPPGEILFEFGKKEVVQSFGDMKQTSKYELDPKKDPKQIKVTMERNGNEVTVTMIYKFEGDKMMVCSKQNPTDGVPEEFSDKDGQNIAVFVRKKKE